MHDPAATGCSLLPAAIPSQRLGKLRKRRAGETKANRRACVVSSSSLWAATCLVSAGPDLKIPGRDATERPHSAIASNRLALDATSSTTAVGLPVVRAVGFERPRTEGPLRRGTAPQLGPPWPGPPHPAGKRLAYRPSRPAFPASSGRGHLAKPGDSTSSCWSLQGQADLRSNRAGSDQSAVNGRFLKYLRAGGGTLQGL